MRAHRGLAAVEEAFAEEARGRAVGRARDERLAVVQQLGRLHHALVHAATADCGSDRASAKDMAISADSVSARSLRKFISKSTHTHKVAKFGFSSRYSGQRCP